MKISVSNTARAVSIVAAAALLVACGGAKEDANQTSTTASTGQVRLGADPEGGAILLTAQENEALTQSQAQQDAAFNKSAAGDVAFKADAVVNQIRFVADFDGDGKDDVLWQVTTGATHISFMNGTAVGNCAAIGVQSDRIMGTGDFNGDGKADIVWRNMNTGAVRISLMDGGTVTSWLNVGASPIALSVKLEAVGDFDGNGRADMLWRNQGTGRSVMSYHNADGSVAQWPLVSNYIALNTSALKVGDINGDGKDDIVWRNMSTGNVVISLMDGNVATWRGITSSPIALSVALEAVGDFDNNGRADLLWRNTRTGNSLMSYHNEDGSVASWPVVSNYINPTSTSAQGVGDFDGDGKDDILWRNLSSGNTVTSLMNGNVPSWMATSFSTCPTRRVLPHTGVTPNQCYGESGNALQQCSALTTDAYYNQQDGDRASINAMSYSVVSRASGGSYDRTECVRDDVTGLIWEGKTASGPRAGINQYTNYTDASKLQVAGDWVCDPVTYMCEVTPTSMPTPAQIAAATNSMGYVNYVNSIQLCGFNDWRVPTRLELMGIVDYSKGRNAGPYAQSVTPTLKTDWFPSTGLSEYLTSTRAYTTTYDPDAGNEVVVLSDDTRVWGIAFDTGEVRPWFDRSGPLSLRLVRGAQ